MGDRSGDVRPRAVEALISVVDRSIESAATAIIATLELGAPAIHFVHAKRALVNILSRDRALGVQVLISLMSGIDALKLPPVLQALPEVAPRGDECATVALAALLADAGHSEKVQCIAMTSFTKLVQPKSNNIQVLSTLIGCLECPHASVRASAVCALASQRGHGDIVVTNKVVPLLGDPSADVRKAVGDVLCKVVDKGNEHAYLTITEFLTHS